MASAILTGALVAGDSVRGSLAGMAASRLGKIDLALVTEGFFREGLADELAARDGFAGTAPAVLLRGSAVQAKSRARASGVGLHGVDGRFLRLFGERTDLGLAGERPPGQIFPPVAINQALASSLGAKEGDDLLLSFGLPGQISGETLLGERDADDRLASRRFTVARVLPDRGLGSFGLAAHQGAPLNAFVPLAELQKDLEREGKVNALFAAAPGKEPPELPRSLLRLEDFDLRLRQGTGGELVVESHGYFLKPAAVAAAEELAAEAGLPSRPVLTYLATRLEAKGRLVPYSLVSALAAARPGLPAGPGAADSGLALADGSPAPALGLDEILLNDWAAADLGVEPGDAIQLSYLAVAPTGGLVTRRATLRLRGVVAMTGLAADRTLTPELPGVEEAEDMAAWDPPFPVDLGLVRPVDERYWDEHGPTPKAFVAEETGRRLWSSRLGEVTSVRIALPAGKVGAVERAIPELPARIDPEAFGLHLRPVKAQALRAAAGATDFGGLLLAFSFFLIASAALLVGLLFSLAVERRAGELGVLLAVGFPVRQVRRRLLSEGLAIAAVGALAGVASGLGYAWLLITGLRTWWLPAVGTPELAIHVRPVSLTLGWLIAVLVVFTTIVWTVRRLSRLPAPALLAGETAPAAGLGPRGRAARLLAWSAGGLAVALLAIALSTGRTSSPLLAFGTGASALVAGLAFFAVRLRQGGAGRPLGSLLGMAASNGAANPGRSLLAVALVASACFLLVVVAANRGGGPEEGETPPGAGGYSLVAEAAVPLLSDLGRALGTPEGRLELGLDEADAGALSGVSALSLRLVPGEDASCLNLFRPGRPRLLGVPAGGKGFHGFAFAQTLPGSAAESNPWSLLERDLGPGVIPAVADANSAQWILHLGLGDELALEDEAGRPLRLRLVGTLARGLLQSELLISEAALLRHFPSRAGRSFFLLATPPGKAGEAAGLLEAALGRYGFDVTTTAGRLVSYHEVEATYLAAFQALGGLGLLLGTVGLGVALLRSVIERRYELAMLRAFGFRRRRLAFLVTAENAFLLVLGMALGTLAGILAVVPRLVQESDRIPWPSLAATLLAVLAVGLLSCLAAVQSALTAPLLPVLKEER